MKITFLRQYELDQVRRVTTTLLLSGISALFRAPLVLNLMLWGINNTVNNPINAILYAKNAKSCEAEFGYADICK